MMKILFLYISIAGVAIAQSFGHPDVDAKHVSILTIKSGTELAVGTKVRVYGVYYWNQEGAYLFFTREHYDYHDTSNAVSLMASGSGSLLAPSDAERINGCSVILEGKLEKSAEGGEYWIREITRIRVIKNAASDREQRGG